MSYRTALMIVLITATAQAGSPQAIDADVCVYTATPSGILAAIAVQRAGRSVVVVEPSRWVGGMLGAGLKPLQDCPNYAATGGLTETLLPTLGRNTAPLKSGDPRSLSPSAIRDDFLRLFAEQNIQVIFDHRIESCDKNNQTIATAVFELAPYDELGCPVPTAQQKNHLRVTARVFIDASYEGDLMAKSGVSYRVGREAAMEFGEDHAGVQPPLEVAAIDPFVQPGHPESGLLAWVESDHGKPEGSADDYTQAYNYRYYTTANPDDRVEFTPPKNYDPLEFELVGRYVTFLKTQIDDEELLRKRLVGIFPGWMNSGEWNYQRNSLFSMAPLGISQTYADGEHATKAKVWKQHQNYLRGLHHFMSTDPRVPLSYREEVQQLGLDRRVHPDTQGWPHQLYIRVARRLQGRYTISAHDVYNQTEIDDPIGLAQYGIDTYPARRICFQQDGKWVVGIEGKMFIGGNRGPTNVPYPIPYRAITPQAAECTNLLVPVCFSATHLGYASARMEPVFMICGESAGIAACQMLREKTTVQKIDMPAFHQALLTANQKLTWDPTVDHPGGSPDRASATYSFEKLTQEADTNQDQRISRGEWNANKSGWEWLFDAIDRDGGGKIDEAEYADFQRYKKEHADWRIQLKKATSD